MACCVRVIASSCVVESGSSPGRPSLSNSCSSMCYEAQGTMPDDQPARAEEVDPHSGTTQTLVIVWGPNGPASVQLLDLAASPRPGASQCPECRGQLFTVLTDKFF